MFRAVGIALTTAMHRQTPFATAALELMRIHIEHTEHTEGAEFTGAEPQAIELEKQFARQLEQIRPMFNILSAMEISRFYSERIFRAMRHFGHTDDPLFRKLELMLGEMHRKRPPQASYLKVPPPARAKEVRKKSVNFTPGEFPAPPDDAWNTKGTQQDPALLHVFDRHRGHWVLREPGVAISKQRFGEDPW